jgi:hypothetical protein
MPANRNLRLVTPAPFEALPHRCALRVEAELRPALLVGRDLAVGNELPKVSGSRPPLGRCFWCQLGSRGTGGSFGARGSGIACVGVTSIRSRSSGILERSGSPLTHASRCLPPRFPAHRSRALPSYMNVIGFGPRM